MKYPNLKIKKENKFVVDSFFKGIDKSEENAHISDCNNMICTSGVLTNRPGIRPTEDKPFYIEDKTCINDAQFFESTLFLNGEYYKVAMFTKEEEEKYVEYSFFLFSEDGRSIEVAKLKFSCTSDSQYYRPRAITVFSHKPKRGCGVFAFVSLENQFAVTKQEKFLLNTYELSFAMDEWITLDFKDLYLPICYKYGAGRFYNSEIFTIIPKAEYGEELNMLTNAGQLLFSTDGHSNEYLIPKDIAKGRDIEYLNCKIQLPDGELLDLTVNPKTHSTGYIDYKGERIALVYTAWDNSMWFVNYVPPLGSANNNMVVTIKFKDDENTNKFSSIEKSVWYSSRESGGFLCLAGNVDNPSQICVSEKNNPFYFTEKSCHFVGDPSQKITALGRQNKSLVIFKEKEIYCADGVSGNLRITHLHSSIGCDLPQTIAICENRLVWANSDNKVYTLNALSDYGAVAVYGMSRAIDSVLQYEDFSSAVACYINRRYYLFLKNKVFVLDLSGALLQSNREFVSAAAWFRWELPEEAAVKLAYTGKNSLNAICNVDNSGKYYPIQFSNEDGTDLFFNGSFTPERKVIECNLKTGVFYDDNYSDRKIITKLFANLFAERDVFVDFIDETGDTQKSTVINIKYNGKKVLALYKILPLLRCLGISVNLRAQGNVKLNKLTFGYKETV